MNKGPGQLRRVFAEFATFWVEVVEHFLFNRCPQLAAALAYYALFSIPPLLIIMAICIGLFVDADEVQATLTGSASAALPPHFSDESVALIRRARAFAAEGPWWSLVLSFLGVVFGATRGFVQLQTALNRAWSIRENDRVSLVKTFFLKRVVSFGVIFGVVAFTSLTTILSTLLVKFQDEFAEFAPDAVESWVNSGASTLLSLGSMTVALTLVYRFLPDAKIHWRDVVPGAIFSALAFEAVKSSMALFLKHLELTEVYGQASSIAALLLWLYISANVVFLGAEVARVWSSRMERRVEPVEGAERDQAARADFAPRVRRWMLGEGAKDSLHA